MSTYAEKLKDPRWQKKRLEILERDGWKCMACGDTETTLHVHHKYYPPGEPWDCDPRHLITLCENCHELEREAMEEYVSSHLQMLKYFGFMGSDIHTLTEVLYGASMRCEAVLFVDALRWSLYHKDSNGIGDKYLKKIVRAYRQYQKKRDG